MVCSCGSETRESAHLVKGLKKAQEWSESVTAADSPVLIDRVYCPACGRQLANVIPSN